MLNLSHIDKAYGSHPVLRDLNLQVPAGSCFCLAGANSCGKTTLLSIAVGLQKPDRGQVTWSGRYSYVPQHGALAEDLTVRDNLRLWYAACGRDPRQMFSGNSAEALFGLSPHKGKSVSSLSGGMKKRLSIAAALLAEPDCLVIDEPFTALDLVAKREISSLLRKIQQRGTTILLASHDPHEIASLCDHIAVMRDGKIALCQQLKDADAEQISRLILSLAAR